MLKSLCRLISHIHIINFVEYYWLLRHLNFISFNGGHLHHLYRCVGVYVYASSAYKLETILFLLKQNKSLKEQKISPAVIIDSYFCSKKKQTQNIEIVKRFMF